MRGGFGFGCVMSCPWLRVLQEFGEVGGEQRIGLPAKPGHRFEKPGTLFGKIRIGRHRGQLIFPKVEILARERGKVRLVTHGHKL